MVTSQETRAALLRTVPELMAMDDATIDSIVAGRAVEVPSSELEVSIDAQEIVSLAIQYLPVVAAALSLIKNGYDLYKDMAEEQAVDEIYTSMVKNNPASFQHVGETAGKEAIRSSLYTALEDSAPKPQD